MVSIVFSMAVIISVDERRMSMSYKVITSKNDLKIPVKKARVVVKEDFIEWLFYSEQEATDATIAFINAGFSSVRREW